MLPPSAAHTTRTRPYRVLAVVVAVIGLLAGLAGTASATTVPASRSTSSAFTLTSSVAPSRLPTLVGPETRVGAADLPPSLFVGSGRSVLAGHVGQTCPAYDGFVVGSCVATNTPGAAEAPAISEKIAGQMGPRGWTPETIGKTVANPAETHSVWDFTAGTKQPATAYVRPDGSYVVVNDATKTVVQVSDATNSNWKAVWNDPRFKR